MPSYLAAAKAATVTGAGYAGAGFDSTIGAALVAAAGASAPIGAYAGAAVAFVAAYIGKAFAIVSAALAQALASADPLVGDLLDVSLGPAIDLCGKAIAAAPRAAATAYTTCGELLVYGGEAAVKYLSAAAAFAINVITNLDAPVGDFLDVVLGGSISALVAAWAALPGLYAAATAKLAIGVDATVSALVGIAKLSASQLQAALASKSISDLLDVTLGNLFNSIQFVATPVYNGAAYAIAEAYLRAGEGVSALLGVGQSGIDAIAAAWAYLAATGAGTAVGSARRHRRRDRATYLRSEVPRPAAAPAAALQRAAVRSAAPLRRRAARSRRSAARASARQLVHRPARRRREQRHRPARRRREQSRRRARVGPDAGVRLLQPCAALRAARPAVSAGPWDYGTQVRVKWGGVGWQCGGAREFRNIFHIRPTPRPVRRAARPHTHSHTARSAARRQNR